MVLLVTALKCPVRPVREWGRDGESQSGADGEAALRSTMESSEPCRGFVVDLGLTVLLCEGEDKWNLPLEAVVGLGEVAHVKQTQAHRKHHRYLFIHS